MGIGTFGSIAFEVSTTKIRTFDDFKRKLSVKYEEHAVIGMKPKLEFIAPGLDEISFQIIFSAFQGINPLKEMEQLRLIVQEGKYNSLVIGGKVLGNFVIESLAEAWKHVDGRGKVLYIAVDVNLKEYSVEQKPATTTATAAAEKAKTDKVAGKIKDAASKAGLATKDIAGLAKTAMAATKNPMAAITGVNGIMQNIKSLQSVAKYANMVGNRDISGALNIVGAGQAQAYKTMGINILDMAKKAQSDPNGAIVGMLGAMAGVGPQNKIDVAGKIFGAKAAGPVMQMSKKVNDLKQEFGVKV